MIGTTDLSILGSRQTYLANIVPQNPSLLGATDAAKAGMGRVYFDADGAAYVWRQAFPPEVQCRWSPSTTQRVPSQTVTWNKQASSPRWT